MNCSSVKFFFWLFHLVEELDHFPFDGNFKLVIKSWCDINVNIIGTLNNQVVASIRLSRWQYQPLQCNGYGFLVRVLSYRTPRFDSGESMRTRNSLRGIYFLMIFLFGTKQLNQRFSCFKDYFRFPMLLQSCQGQVWFLCQDVWIFIPNWNWFIGPWMCITHAPLYSVLLLKIIP